MWMTIGDRRFAITLAVSEAARAFAEMLPQHLIPSWFGTGTGPWGLIIASVAGALTPGGPVVGFAIAAAALKGGAGAPQVIAYTIAWALFALPRVLIYEIP